MTTLATAPGVISTPSRYYCGVEDVMEYLGLDEYNAKQKRKDRKIKNYYEKISRSKQEKLFYEVIVQIGNREDTGVDSFVADLATCVLEDYVKKFQERNPNLYVFGAYIHLYEETPHVHIDFVPWVSGCKRGLETHTSLKAALATRGFDNVIKIRKL